MLIYLRHGDDRGPAKYRHDRHLNARGRKQARKASADLVARYGQPDAVLVSPFRRAVETLEEMSKHFTHAVGARDGRLAQYLGEKRRAPRINPKTASCIDAAESKDAFRARVQEHVRDVQKRAKVASIWCITHQIVIEEVSGHFGMQIRADLDFLDHVVMLR